MHLHFIYFLYFVLLDMTPMHCILFNPRPHLGGGGGATPQVVFLAGPNSVSDREPIFAYSCISNFSPGSLKFEVSMTFGSWNVTLFSRSCRGHIFISSHT